MPSSHNFRSYVVSELVDTGELAKKLHAAHSTIDPRAAINHRISHGEMFAFNFGAIVFWNVPDEAQAAELSSLIDLPGLVKDSMCSEDFVAIEDPDKAPRVEFNRILIDHLSKDRAEVIASTIAQSTTMEYYESMCEEAWTEVDAIIATLKVRGKLSPSPNMLMRRVAHCLELRSRVVRVLHLLDRPDLIWEDKVMDELYSDLRAMFDLDERFQALEYKLQLIQQSLELLVDTSRDRRLYWVEMAIVLLIVFEIVITMIPGGH